MEQKQVIKIFDTTLRDGEQSPGATMNIKEKIKIAKQLEKLGVDIIEAGFPAASPGDFEAVRQVAKEVTEPVICGLCRSRKEDIDAAKNALLKAKKFRIHVFLATSPIHREYKLKMTKDQVIESAVKGVKYACQFTPDVEFSAEDAVRTEKDFLAKVVQEVIAAGATTVNVPDTVGYSIPFEYGNLIKYLFDNVSNINQTIISVHCHNDLGMGVANSLAAIMNGARQIECTINGLGERAGNASLEEVVMAIKTRKDLLHAFTNINTKEIVKTSKLVSNITGILVQPNKAIVGANAFSHEAGIHQHGVLKERTTYEIMDPKEVGWGESQIVLGKHSGRFAFEKRVKFLGYDLESAELEKTFQKFKEICDLKKKVYDEDIESIIENDVFHIPEIYDLKEIQMNYVCSVSKKKLPHAQVILHDIAKNKNIKGVSMGDGPVDAIYKAIEKITKIKATLEHYAIRSVTSGKDALGEVTVKISVLKNFYVGRSSSPDILEASANAYLQAVNSVLKKRKRKK